MTTATTERRGPWPRRLRWAERVAWILAAVLGVSWAVVRGLGWVSERRAVAAFHEVERARSVPVLTAMAATNTARLDQSLWDAKRIRAYAQALTQPAPPPLALLRIPRIRLEVPVFEGTDGWSLNRGVGHIEGTARPGEAGNVGIAGHRDSFFRVLKDITEGDRIEVVLPGEVRGYRVHRLLIVAPSEVSVLSPSAGARLTLVTCYPFYFVGSAPKRFIVVAETENDRASL